MNYDFISKRVVIQAFQMTRERRYDNRDWPEWLHRAWNGAYDCPGTMQIANDYDCFPDSATRCDLEIVTLEGNHHVTWDDWIICGLRGELYPCKPDVFAAKYEPLLEENI